jgi:hypothetical protein
MSVRPSTLVLVLLVALSSLVFLDLTSWPVRGVQRELEAPLEPGAVIAGVWAFVAVLAAAIRVYRVPSSFLAWSAVLLLFFGIMAFAMPGRAVAYAKPLQDLCATNLRKIVAALLEYRVDHGDFPPSHLLGADGKPMHSWRVLILPYLGYGELYGQYDFNEPWNGSRNAKLAERRPDVFYCAAARQAKAETNYVAITGARSVWNSNNLVSMRTAHPCGSALLVEVTNSGICWMEPRDFDQGDAVADEVANLATARLDSGHPKDVLFACADHSVWRLPKESCATTLSTILNVDPVGRVDWCQSRARLVNPNDAKWGRLATRAAFPVWFLTVLLLLSRARRSGIVRMQTHSNDC